MLSEAERVAGTLRAEAVKGGVSLVFEWPRGEEKEDHKPEKREREDQST